MLVNAPRFAEIARIVYFVRVSRSRPNLTDRMDRVERELGVTPRRTPRQWTRDNTLTLGILLVALIALIAGYVEWWQPQQAAHAQHDLETTIDGRIDNKVGVPRINERLSNIETLLHSLDQNVTLLLKKDLHITASLGKPGFEKNLDAVAAQLTLARNRDVKIDEKDQDQFRENFVSANPASPGYWAAAAAYINYRSPALPAGMPNCLESEPIAKIERAVVKDNVVTFTHGPLVWKDCRIELDSPALQGANAKRLSLADLELRHCWIVYRGGPFVAAVVPGGHLRFIECLFQMILSGPPAEGGKTLLDGLLAARDISDVGVRIPTS